VLPDDGGGEGVGDGEQEGHHGARPASRSFKIYFALSIFVKKIFFPKLLQKINN
jgi:hypothetical protein